MQPDPQPPSQRGYPQFQNTPQQPTPQNVFNVSHNKPYNQPQHPYPHQTQEYAKYQLSHPQQKSQYIPPQPHNQPLPQQIGQIPILPTQNNISTTSNLQTGSAASENENCSAQKEVELIDERLSSGCYACYNCWLYVSLIAAILGMYTDAASMISMPIYFFAFLEALATFGYAFTMINVMKDKKMAHVEWGIKLAFATALLLPGTIYAQYTFYADHTDNAEYIFFMCIPYALYDYFVMIIPALKIRNYIQARDTALRKPTDAYYI